MKSLQGPALTITEFLHATLLTFRGGQFVAGAILCFVGCSFLPVGASSSLTMTNTQL